MSYQAINWSDVSSFAGMLTAVNSQTSGYFWSAMVFLVFAVLVVISLGIGFEGAILFGAFIGLVLSIFTLYMGLTALWFTAIFVGLIIIMAIYIMWGNKYD